MSISKEELIQIVMELLTHDQMKELKTRLMEASKKEEVETQPHSTSRPKVVNEDFTVNKDTEVKASRAVVAGENVWVDEGEDRDDFDKKIIRKDIPRTRPKFEKKSVTCSVCNRTYEVAPSLARNKSYYRCEKCIGGN